MNRENVTPRRPLGGWRTLAEDDAERAAHRKLVKRLAYGGMIVGFLSWVVMIALALYAGHLFAVGIGGAR